MHKCAVFVKFNLIQTNEFMDKNQREQRCIQLYDRFKAHFERVLTLDDAQKEYYPSAESREFNRMLAARYAADFCMLMIRLTSHMGVDDFNDNWFFFSDFIYQDEDLDCQHAIESKQKEDPDDDD